MSTASPRCATCPIPWGERACHHVGGRGPENCPLLTCPELIPGALEELQNVDILKMAQQSSIQEAQGYTDRDLGYARVRPLKPRILETLEFARRMGYQRLGLVFCVGLRREARLVAQFLENQGLEIVSVVCKVGRVPKTILGLTEADHIIPGTVETMCNPILQAKIVNAGQTQFNIALGLCVGHDSLFFKFAQAPTTVLAVKDRLLGHNPLAAVYNLESYYRYLKSPLP
ncbi:MAG: metal-binding protein [Desulfobacca sp. 4484_104]|nr:MAG: metal-binding protein [Desulfobacca sp. 4484_104]RLA89367.1 MAG: metal-binding protein [Deltaproteobacteria bacterium]